MEGGGNKSEDGRWRIEDGKIAMNSHPPSSIFHPRRILVRGTNWLGDAVMTTPALLRLREKFPDAHITVLVPEKLRDLWLHHPAANETISFAPGESVFSTGKKLRAGKFDLALVLPNSPRSAIESWLAGIPRRVGYARPWRNFFLTTRVAPRPDAVKMRKRTPAEIHQLIKRTVSEIGNRKSEIGNVSAHQIHEYLHLVAGLGASGEPLPPKLETGDDEVQAVVEKFGLADAVQSRLPLYGLNPGAEYGPAKRWPVERFIATAIKVQQQRDGLWLMFGGQSDSPIAQRIEYGMGGPLAIMNFAGRTSLRELMVLLKLCRVLLTNDSGPMHVAAALGTPVVVPFGSTSPELTGPGLPGDARNRLLKSDAPCSPCFLRECPIDFRCLNGISVERVVEAVLETLR
jgi:heptosyltransferase-2